MLRVAELRVPPGRRAVKGEKEELFLRRRFELVDALPQGVAVDEGAGALLEVGVQPGEIGGGGTALRDWKGGGLGGAETPALLGIHAAVQRDVAIHRGGETGGGA